jgi:hypothetical protein
VFPKDNPLSKQKTYMRCWAMSPMMMNPGLKDAMMMSLQPTWPQMSTYAKEDHISKCWCSEHQGSLFEFY